MLAEFPSLQTPLEDINASLFGRLTERKLGGHGAWVFGGPPVCCCGSKEWDHFQ